MRLRRLIPGLLMFCVVSSVVAIAGAKPKVSRSPQVAPHHASYVKPPVRQQKRVLFWKRK